MGWRDVKLKPRADRKKKGKITVYPDLKIQRLYELGQDNGWETIESIREVVTLYLLEKEEEIQTKSPTYKPSPDDD